MGTLVAVRNKKGGDAAEAAITMLRTLKCPSAKAFGIASPAEVVIETSVEALQKRKVDSPVVIGHVFTQVRETDRPQPMKLENATLVFDGRLYSAMTQTSDAEAVAEKLKRDPRKPLEAYIERAQADFALAVAEPKRLIAGRDLMGSRPLYYGENTESVALASERKALWRIGIQKTRSFPPGHIGLFGEGRLDIAPVKTLGYLKTSRTTMAQAAKKLQRLLQRSVLKRIQGQGEVAVAFSGGLDSSIVAFLASRSGANTQLIHVGLKDQPEAAHAREVAEELKLPINVYAYDERDVERTLDKALRLIEEPYPIQTAVGIPLCWAAEKTAEMNIKVLLAGQGADELFGGYKRYVDAYLTHGKEKAQETISMDILRLYENNLERDAKICSFHGLELCSPFAVFEVARFAFELPIELKIERADSTLRKLVLRQMARNIGLPSIVAEKPKKAIQYATGVERVLKKLSRREGLTTGEYLRKRFNTVFEMMQRE
jgi:asparagine synthase (glutamine-hydrolysing)